MVIMETCEKKILKMSHRYEILKKCIFWETNNSWYIEKLIGFCIIYHLFCLFSREKHISDVFGAFSIKLWKNNLWKKFDFTANVKF